MRPRIGLAIALAGAAVLGAGAVAVAQARGEDPEAERRAFLEDAAGRLGVDAGELETALREAAIARVDAAVEAGELTDEQATELKERIRSGGFPLPGVRPGPGFGHGGPGFLHGGPGFLDAAASYLGLDEEELRKQLAEGDSLADLAEAAGQSVEGLQDAILEQARTKLEEAVSEDVLTRERADAILERLESHLDEIVDGAFDRGPWRHRFGTSPGGDSSSQDTSFLDAA